MLRWQRVRRLPAAAAAPHLLPAPGGDAPPGPPMLAGPLQLAADQMKARMETCFVLPCATGGNSGAATAKPARVKVVTHLDTAQALPQYVEVWQQFAQSVSGTARAARSIVQWGNVRQPPIGAAWLSMQHPTPPPLSWHVATQTPGEWDGVSVTCSADGTVQQLPEHYVPGAYREWGVEVLDWQTQCSCSADSSQVRGRAGVAAFGYI